MSEFYGPNEGYVLELYERYRQSPESVDAATRSFFQNWAPPSENGSTNGVVISSHTVHDTAPSAADLQKAVGAVNYVQAIRLYGHLDAQLDPLGTAPPGDPELAPEAHGITEDDLRALPATLVDSPAASGASSALEAVQALREVYSSSIGFDFDHIRIPEERAWLREAAESRRYRYTWDTAESKALLERLTQVEAFESFLQKTFPTKYRFSIEGLDTMVPMLDEVIHLSADTDTETIAIAMAHRGRLNILTHIMGKPYEKILGEFKDMLEVQELRDAIGWTTGDVKYHMGVKRSVNGSRSGSGLTVTMPPNPSHLEAVNPIAVGMARAAGTRVDHPGAPNFNPALTMQILIHGDASFPGQGIVAETFNLSQLPGYWTGGTLHIIANNQLGFTTAPRDGRSTLYASDLAKGFKVPIIHVNADDPAACMEVIRIAFAYQKTFEKDVLIDLVGYRRYGHNELDEPSFTQPLLYQRVRGHETVRQLWAATLAQRGMIKPEDAEALIGKYSDNLQSVYDSLPPAEQLAERPPAAPPRGAARSAKTSVSMERLTALNAALGDIPESFSFYSKRLENTIRARRAAFDEPNANGVDWATAEELAFASILEDGTAIRLSGQDSERGTFSHRHAVLNDGKTGEKYVPLHNLPQGQAAFEVYNSPLSEEAVLGFEYGYNVQEPDRLVLWEAQYGDFNNGAQTIIDEFVVSAREKWGQTPSLVMLLPHGHEGAGPDHSSARLERFLQMAAKFNIRIAYPTTAAQYFHLLRRQALLLGVDPLPLIVMSPKSLLRNPAVSSSVNELMNGRWQSVIDDAEAQPEAVRRLILTSGKLYYDLVGSDYRSQSTQIAIARVEQLYPFPTEDLKTVISRYSGLTEVIWAQEEPKNMGAWEFMSWRLEKLLREMNISLPVHYVGRRRSSSPAEGSKSAWTKNQSIVVNAAFHHQFDEPVKE